MVFRRKFSAPSDHREAVYISSGAFRTRSVPALVSACVSNGLSALELGSGLNWSSDMLTSVRATSEAGIRYLVHNYFPPHQDPFVLNLAASDPTMLARSKEHCRRAVDLSAELGAKFYSVHAGFAFDAKPEDLGGNLTAAPRHSLEEAHDTFVGSLRDLCAYAADRGVKFAVENNVIASFNLIGGRNRLGLCASAEDILRTQADVGSPNLGFLIDVGHLKVTARALNFSAHAFLDLVGSHVVAMHLSENDGLHDQNLPFNDHAWFLPRLADFPDATMILEAYKLDVDQMRTCCAVVDRARHRHKVG